MHSNVGMFIAMMNSWAAPDSEATRAGQTRNAATEATPRVGAVWQAFAPYDLDQETQGVEQ